MTWTYSPSKVETSPVDQVRLNIGDTVYTDPQFQDEELARFLATRNSIAGACADACRALAAKFSRSVNSSAATAKIAYSDLSKAYLRMATGFDQKAILAGSGLLYAGGISVSDKNLQVCDTDRVQPQFNLGLDDNDLLPYGPAANQTEAESEPDDE